MLNEFQKPVSHRQFNYFVGIKYETGDWLFKQRRSNATVAGCSSNGQFFVMRDFTDKFNDAELLEIIQIASEFENA